MRELPCRRSHSAFSCSRLKNALSLPETIQRSISIILIHVNSLTSSLSSQNFIFPLPKSSTISIVKGILNASLCTEPLSAQFAGRYKPCKRFLAALRLMNFNYFRIVAAWAKQASGKHIRRKHQISQANISVQSQFINFEGSACLAVTANERSITQAKNFLTAV